MTDFTIQPAIVHEVDKFLMASQLLNMRIGARAHRIVKSHCYFDGKPSTI